MDTYSHITDVFAVSNEDINNQRYFQAKRGLSQYFRSSLRTKSQDQTTFKKQISPGKEDLLMVDALSNNPTKWSNTLKQFVSCCELVAQVCFPILWGGRLKG